MLSLGSRYAVVVFPSVFRVQMLEGTVGAWCCVFILSA